MWRIEIRGLSAGESRLTAILPKPRLDLLNRGGEFAVLSRLSPQVNPATTCKLCHAQIADFLINREEERKRRLPDNVIPFPHKELFKMWNFSSKSPHPEMHCKIHILPCCICQKAENVFHSGGFNINEQETTEQSNEENGIEPRSSTGFERSETLSSVQKLV